MTVKLWVTLPRDHEANGLTAIEKDLIDRPEATHVVVAIINRKRVNTDDDTHETVPTARVVHIEPLLSEQDSQTARKLLMDALLERTGASTLPFDDAAFPEEETPPDPPKRPARSRSKASRGADLDSRPDGERAG